MTDRALGDLDPRLQILAQKFLDQCQAEEIDSFITETYRNEAEQNADYAQGRTAPGRIITNARYGESPHNCVDENGNPAARAFDFAMKDATGILDWDASDPEWQRAISIGEALGLFSGSEFHSPKDSPHLELHNWKVDNSNYGAQPIGATV